MRISVRYVPGDASHASAARFDALDLPPEKVDAFRVALDGVRYDRTRRQRVVPIDKLSAILRRLREADLPVTVEREVVREMQKRTMSEWFDYQSVKDRILRMDQEIQKRTAKKGQKGFKLFDYQIPGAIWLSGRKGALLADEQGLGKSLQVVVALPSQAPCVVVAPAKVKADWKREFNTWRPLMPVTVLQGRKGFRWPRPGEVLVLNYEIIPSVHNQDSRYGRLCDGTLPAKRCPGCLRSATEMVIGPKGAAEFKIIGHTTECKGFMKPDPCPGCSELLRNVPKGTVWVGDEAQRIKAYSAEQTKRFFALAEACRNADGRTWLVTGTPIENHPKDLWTLYRAAGIAEEAFGDWDTFASLFKGQKTRFGWSWELPDADDTEEIATRIRRVSLRRLKRDVMKDMPEKIWREIEVDIDRDTMRACEDALDEAGGSDAYEKLLEGEDELLEKAMPKFKRISAMRARLASAKIPAMLERVEVYEDKGEPLIVFCNHRAPLELLGERPGWRTVIGGDTEKAAREAIDLFQAGKLKGIACATRAAGAGLTLTRGAVMLFVDRDFTPAKNQQAEARFHRIGQTRGVLIEILVANHPLDARQAEISLRKQKYMELGVDVGATSEGVARDEEFEARIRAVQEEIACGLAVRRPAGSDAEQEALDKLHLCVFGDRADARLAVDLAEEATLVGLSEAQWSLAVRIAERGRIRDDVPDVTIRKTEEAHP